jgi:hypothetical protein
MQMPETTLEQFAVRSQGLRRTRSHDLRLRRKAYRKCHSRRRAMRILLACFDSRPSNVVLAAAKPKHQTARRPPAFE